MPDADFAILKELGYVSAPQADSQWENSPKITKKPKKEQCTGCKIRKGRTKCVLCQLKERRLTAEDTDSGWAAASLGGASVGAAAKGDDKALELIDISEVEEDDEDEFI